MSEIGNDTFEALCAYHDGELRGLARWRFERRLRREPGLRGELAALGRVGDLVRENEAAAEPDLWDRIELRLPAVYAQRAGSDVARSAAPAPWWRPLGALGSNPAVLIRLADRL